ncbi:PaaI family thioesterase [Aquincola sp. MAHUQ-54]|uniref:PaaI family thioesterase n=2 Tax=Sphaerotilaceae TaxID=2975441 RepID=A0AAW9QNI0_9BURK
MSSPDLLFDLSIPLAGTFGLRGEAIGDDRAVVRLPYAPAHANSRGEVHGGALAVLFDCCLAAAVRSHAPAQFGVVTIDLSVHYVAASDGDVVCTAVCERRGRSISFARGEARNAAGDLLALATGTFKLFERAPRA